MQVYYPGQSVSGLLQVVSKEPKWYQYAAVSLQGKGFVSWTEGNSREDMSLYYDKETYVDMLFVVWGDKNAPLPIKFDPGTSNFPFQFTIPAHCPPTFNGGRYIGKIAYELFGIIVSQKNEYKIETPLVVGAIVDLNLQPHLLQPFDQSQTKSIIKCCCCNAGEAEVTLKMPQSGFHIKKDRIPVTLECRNGSSQEISLVVKFSQNATYKAQGRRYAHRKNWEESVDIFSCSIPALTSETKSANPNIPQSINLKLGFKSKIIELSHSVSLWVTHASDCSCCGSPSPTIETLVVIGNVPFHSGETNAAPTRPPLDPEMNQRLLHNKVHFPQPD